METDERICFCLIKRKGEECHGKCTDLTAPACGAPCQAIVKAGDAVEKGTLIATPTGLGANIFSSVYGVVEEVTDDRIIIKPDEEQKEEFVPIKEGTKLEMVKEAGIVGMGGAGFPTGD